MAEENHKTTLSILVVADMMFLKNDLIQDVDELLQVYPWQDRNHVEVMREEHIKVTSTYKKWSMASWTQIIFPWMIAFVISHGSMRFNPILSLKILLCH